MTTQPVHRRPALILPFVAALVAASCALLPATANANTIDAIKTVTWYFDNLPNTSAVGSCSWTALAQVEGGNLVDGTKGGNCGGWTIDTGLHPAKTADTGKLTGTKGSTADAEVDVAVDKPTPGDFGYTITGTIHTNDQADAAKDGTAMAKSSGSLQFAGGMITGDKVTTATGTFGIKANLTEAMLSSSTAGGGSWHDPVSVSFMDLTTGALITQDLVEMDTQILGSGGLSWGAGGFSITAPSDGVSSVLFSLDPLSPWITDPSLVNSTLSYSGGTFNATGIFANLPWVVGPGQVTLPGGVLDSITVPYQVPAGLINPTDEYVPGISFSESAQVNDGTPEPATAFPVAIVALAFLAWTRRSPLGMRRLSLR